MNKMTLDEIKDCIASAVDYTVDSLKSLLNGFNPTENYVQYTDKKGYGYMDYLDIVKPSEKGDTIPLFVLADKKGTYFSFIVNDYEVIPMGGNLEEEVKKTLCGSINRVMIRTLAEKNPDYVNAYSSYHYYKDIRDAKVALDAINDLLDRGGVAMYEDEIMLGGIRDILHKISTYEANGSKEASEELNPHRTYLEWVKMEEFGKKNK